MSAVTVLQERRAALTATDLRTVASVIASMQQRGSLTISAETKLRQVPEKDHEGKIYGWRYELVETGDFSCKLDDPTAEEMVALEQAVAPGSKAGIHQALEILAQIKPVGKSEVKQGTRIGYLAFDLFDEGISEFVVSEVCRDYRKNSEDKFFPDHSEFLKKARQAMKKYRSALECGGPEKQRSGPKTEPERDYPVGEERKRLADGFQKLGDMLKMEVA